MATMTIHNLDDGLKLRLRVRAAMHGRSVEEEACEILRRAIGGADPPRDIASGGRHTHRQPRSRQPAPGRTWGDTRPVPARNTGVFAACGIQVIDPWR